MFCRVLGPSSCRKLNLANAAAAPCVSRVYVCVCLGSLFYLAKSPRPPLPPPISSTRFTFTAKLHRQRALHTSEANTPTSPSFGALSEMRAWLMLYITAPRMRKVTHCVVLLTGPHQASSSIVSIVAWSGLEVRVKRQSVLDQGPSAISFIIALYVWFCVCVPEPFYYGPTQREICVQYTFIHTFIGPFEKPCILPLVSLFSLSLCVHPPFPHTQPSLSRRCCCYCRRRQERHTSVGHTDTHRTRKTFRFDTSVPHPKSRRLVFFSPATFSRRVELSLCSTERFQPRVFVFLQTLQKESRAGRGNRRGNEDK